MLPGRFSDPDGIMKGTDMIHLTKLNGEPLILNCKLIEYIEIIPETKIVMMNGKFHLVKEAADTVIDRAVSYYARIRTMDVPVVDNRELLLENSADNA